MYAGRSETPLSPEKADFQRSEAEGTPLKGLSFLEVVRRIQPTAIIGAAAQRGAFSQEVLQALCQVGQHPGTDHVN